jgi:hypothetical protein
MFTFIITLKDNSKVEVNRLSEPHFLVKHKNDSSMYYKSYSQYKDELKMVESIYLNDPHEYFVENIGTVRNFDEVFEVYKMLRNPVVSVEVKN